MIKLKAKHAFYLGTVRKLKKTFNLFLDKRIVIIPTVHYLFTYILSLLFSLIWIFDINTFFIAKLLVTTGYYEDSYDNGRHSEVINLDDEDIECHELANSAHPVQAAAGGLVSGKPMICGGFYDNPLTHSSNKCFIPSENQSITMAYERSYPSSISISRDKVIFTF